MAETVRLCPPGVEVGSRGLTPVKEERGHTYLLEVEERCEAGAEERKGTSDPKAQD